MGPGDHDDVIRASPLFDMPADREATRRFLESSIHHLLVAYEDDEPTGFVSGVELTHPDKGTEMFLYELGVDDRFRGRGIGKALVAALAELARAKGCYGMWVLTDEANDAGMATYRAAGGSRANDQVMVEWTFNKPGAGATGTPLSS